MKKLTICGRNIAEYAIILKPTPAPAEKTAAEFLQKVIKTACGVDLPVSDTAVHGIYIGTREASLDVKGDGFRMSTDDKNLYLDGNIPRGTLYAAYDFAEKYLGYRLFAPDCEVIPTDGEADVSTGLDFIDNPVIEERRCSCKCYTDSGEYTAFMRLNSWGRPEYGGGLGISGACHTFDDLCPSGTYFKEHPEYYSLWKGERHPTNPADHPNGAMGQLCLTNPDVLRIVTDNVLAYLREHPNERVVDVSQADNGRYCQCEKCAAVDEEEGGQSGTMIRFVNAVAEEVEKEFPNVLIRTFAYQYTRKAPKKTKARHNVLIRYCTIEACFRHAMNDPHCPTNSKIFGPELTEWQNMAENLSIWDYITNWECFTAPFPNLYSIKENARFFADCHAIHVYESTNSGNNGGVYPMLKAYLVGKLLWNPYMSDEEYNRHMNEFLGAYYGKGWEKIRRYIEIEHEVTAEREMTCWAEADIAMYHAVPGNPKIWDYIASWYTPRAYQPIHPDETYLSGLIARMDEVKALFDEAMELAETDKQREHLYISRISLKYMELFCMPHEKSKMTEEQRAAYEAEVEQFYIDKEKYGFRYNNWTASYNQR